MLSTTLVRLPQPAPFHGPEPDGWRALIRAELRRYDELRAHIEGTRGLLSSSLIPVLIWIGRLHFALDCTWAGESALSDALSLLELHEPQGPRIAAVRAVLLHRDALEQAARGRPRRRRGPGGSSCARAA